MKALNTFTKIKIFQKKVFKIHKKETNPGT